MFRTLVRACLALSTLSIILVAVSARAQSPATPTPAAASSTPAPTPVAATPAPTPVAAAPAPAPSTVEGVDVGGDPSRRGPALDPNLDRGFVLPTGMTQPAGSLTYSNYELLLHGITYGITDRVQASLTILPPYLKDMPFVGMLSLKARVVSTPRFHLAGQISGTLASGSSDSAAVVSLGLLPSICLDDGCESLLSASATLVTGSGASALVYGGSLIGRVSEHAKLLAEVVSAAGGSDFKQAPIALLNYGVRFHSSKFAGDIGLVRPFGSDTGSEFVLGFPFVSFSYRNL